MRDAEVGCEACADEFHGFGSARFALEESQKKPGDYLRDSPPDKYFLSLFIKLRTGARTSVASRLLAPNSHNVFGRCFTHSSNFSSTSLVRLDLNKPVYSRSVRS